MFDFFKSIKKSILPEHLFFAAFIARLIIATLDTTMFPSVGIARKVALLIVLSCSAAKIILYDSYSLSEILVMTGIGACMVLNMINTGQNILLVLFLLVVASKGVDFKKIIMIYLIVVGSIVTFTMICSLSGVIENLKYWIMEGGYYRNSFGIGYCTDFAARIFFLLLSYFYMRRDRLKWFEYILALFLTAFVYFSTRGKLDTICMSLIIVVFFIGNMITRENRGINPVLKEGWISFWRYLSPVFMFFVSFIMIALTYLYDGEIAWMAKLNDLITSRLSYAHNTWMEYGFGLFGQKVEMVGFGGTLIWPENYNYIDCSYINMLVVFGSVALIVFLLTYFYGSYKNRSDIYLLYAVVIVSINAMIAHHLFDMSYNPFTFMIMASVLPVSKEREEYAGKKIQCYINF